MKTIIAGSRIGPSYQDVISAIEQCGWLPTLIVSGTAKGADLLGEQWAIENNIPIEKYPPDWKKHGKAAGPVRNKLMAENAEALIALWDGKSTGTKHIIDYASKLGLRVYVKILQPVA